MKIKKLELKNYRNYENLEINFHDKVNIILGNNGQGKTNLLESLYLSAFGKSFKTNKDNELIKFGEDYSNVKIVCERDVDEIKVEIRLFNGSKKEIKIDNMKLSKTSQLLNNVLIVIFSPEDLKIVKDEPEKRRKFIDKELSQISPKYLDSLINYKKVLAQRNIYLKNEFVDEKIVDLWDYQLAQFGAYIIKKREKFIENLSDFSNDIHESITNNQEKLEIRYNPNVEIQSSIELQESYFYEQLKNSYENDLKNRNTSKGPHKDDISFIVNKIDMRNFGSQGQQRTCALSLKLAELVIVKKETGQDAILLLDDVMSELDYSRQEYLIKTLSENQIFITTTEIDNEIKEKFKYSKIIYIEKGKIKEQ